MKHWVMTFILIVGSIFCAQNIFSYNIPQKGKWGDEDFRSFVPAPPVASIDEKVLSINFATPLSDLTVQVKDNKTGVIVYEGCISAESAQSYTIMNGLNKGDYTLTFTHEFGFLTGSFIVE